MTEGSAIQLRNDDLVNLLRPDFQDRNEPNFAAKSLVSLFSIFPAQRGLWYAGNYNEQAWLTDLTGNGSTAYPSAQAPNLYVAETNVPSINYTGAGVTEWHIVNDNPQLSITGLESEVVAAKRGFSMAGWFRITETQTNRGLSGKWDSSAGNFRGYLLYISGTVRPSFAISIDGIATSTTVAGDIITSFDDRWYFFGATFDPSSYTRLFVGDSLGNYGTFTDSTAIPASIFNTPADFYIGSDQAGAANQCLSGKMSICTVAAAVSEDSLMRMVWEQSRSFYPPI